MSASTDATITLAVGIELARLCEKALYPLYYHVALGGSVLHRGESQKDVDLFIYPHRSTRQRSTDEILAALGNAGFVVKEHRNHEPYDCKVVFHVEHSGRRVDLFFVV